MIDLYGIVQNNSQRFPVFNCLLNHVTSSVLLFCSEAFKALDADGDGVVSKEDLKKKLLQAEARKTPWVKI